MTSRQRQRQRDVTQQWTNICAYLRKRFGSFLLFVTHTCKGLRSGLLQVHSTQLPQPTVAIQKEITKKLFFQRRISLLPQNNAHRHKHNIVTVELLQEGNQHGRTVRPHRKHILHSVPQLALGDPTKNREIRPLPAIGQQLRICKPNAQNLPGAIAAALKACAQAQFCIGHTNGCSDKKLNQREHLLLHWHNKSQQDVVRMAEHSLPP